MLAAELGRPGAQELRGAAVLARLAHTGKDGLPRSSRESVFSLSGVVRRCLGCGAVFDTPGLRCRRSCLR
jgi:hypothetical protein